MGNPVMHFEIRATNAQGQASFYSELFGWTMGGEDPHLSYRMIDTGSEAGIQGGFLPAQAGLKQGLTVYAQVDDLQVALDRAHSLGATTVEPPTKLPGPGSFAVVSDPEGNQVGLLQL